MSKPEWPHLDAGFAPTIDIEPRGQTPGFTHVWESDSVWAIRAALGARRPLLVLGEPGTGKSQLARAAARALKRPLISEVIMSRTEPQDLHYRFDAVARLGQAQVLGLANKARRVDDPDAPASPLSQLDERCFLLPGPLWWVFNWESARIQRQSASLKGPMPELPPEAWHWTPAKGCVLLLDEIDKADSDLPNGLLESLGQGDFQVPYLSEPVRCSASDAPPLVIITSNQERELPAAFLRRCLVLKLSLPSEPAALRERLIERGRAHFGSRCADAVYLEAAQQIATDREPAAGSSDAGAGEHRPGQAEYLDLLRAVLEIVGPAEASTVGGNDGAFAQKQLDVLKSIRDFALDKRAPLL